MTCPNCANNNHAGTNFCVKCGAALPQQVLSPIAEPTSSDSKTPDNIIFISILVMTVVALFSTTIRLLADEWYRPPIQYIFVFFNFLTALIPLALSFAIKNKTLKIIGMVAAAIYVLHNLYQSVKWIFDMH